MLGIEHDFLLLRHKLGTADYVILVCHVKLVEISAPAPNSYDEIFMIFGMLLRIEQNLSVYRIDLKLMSAKVDKCFNESGYLLYSVLVSKGILVHFHSERTAVNYLGKVVLSEGLDTRKRSVELTYRRG